MSTEVLQGQGRVNDVGLLVIAAIFDERSKAAFWKEFFNTPAGQKIRPYMTSDTARQRLCDVAARWHGADAEITLDQMGKAAEALLAVKDPAVVPPTPEPAPEPAVERQRDSQGRFLSEFEVWANEPTRSMAEIRNRAANDAAFGNWYRSTVQAQTIQQGEFRVLGAPARTPGIADQQVLGEFVKAFTNTPTSQMRPIAGFITLAGKKYTKQQFNDLVEKAASAGLI